MSAGLIRSIADRLIPPNTNRRMLYRALREVSRAPGSFGRRFNAVNLRYFRRYAKVRFNCPVCGEYARPLYDFPDVALRTEHHIGVLRETLQCSSCVASLRQRALAIALLEQVGRRSAPTPRSVAELAERGLGGLRILDTDNFSAISRLLRGARGYTRCSFLPDRPLGALLEAGYYNEDLQRLSFADASFDLVLTSDVMEHVRDADAAHREIFRVLAPGGAYLFNVPCDLDRDEDLKLVDTSGDEDVFLCKPHYHGDPLSDGILAYRVFGRSLIRSLEALGFTVRFELLQREEHLVVDGDVFVASKPVTTSPS